MAAQTRRAILALALGSAPLGAATADNAPPPQLTEVSREEAPGVSLRVLTLPIDAERARRDNYFASRAFVLAFRQAHLTTGWSASQGNYWIGLGFDPYKVAAAVSPDRSVYFVAKVNDRPGSELILTGTKDQPHLRICEVRFKPAAFPRGSMLVTSYLVQRIVQRDGCSLKGLGDAALQAEMRAPLEFKDYEVVEQRAFPGGRSVTVVEFRGRDNLSRVRAAGRALGVSRFAEVSLLPGGWQAITMVRQTSGAVAYLLHNGEQNMGDTERSVCVFQGFTWPQAAMPGSSQTWPLPESDDPATAFCRDARKRSYDRYINWLMEAAKKNPPRAVPLPN